MNYKKLEQEVMEQVKKGSIKMRSKYLFIAEKLGLGSAFVLTVLLSVLFFSLVLFYLKNTDNLYYLSFGSMGFGAFLESFPYLLIISFILFLFLSGYIISKTDLSYSKPFSYLAVALTSFILIAGIFLSFTGLAEKIEMFSGAEHPFGKVFRPLLPPDFEHRNRGIVAEVVEINKVEKKLVVATPISNIEVLVDEKSLLKDLKIGDIVIIVGEKVADSMHFKAGKIKVLDQKKIDRLQNRLKRKPF